MVEAGSVREALSADQAVVSTPSPGGWWRQARDRRLQGGLLLAALLVAALLGWYWPQVNGSGPAIQSQLVLTDTGEATVQTAPPPPNRVAIPRGEAIQRAGTMLTRPEAASAVEAQAATVTLTGTAAPITDRHVWLVTYRGLVYSASVGCTCYTQQVPHTVVVLDAVDGRPLIVYGAA